jgi:hypothetical protein
MELRPAALRFVLEQGLPATIEVGGSSMEPTIHRRDKVRVVALAPDAALAPGDVVLVATAADVLLLHRVMHVFEEGGAPFVVHQGDAAGSTFGVAARHDVLARMAGFGDVAHARAETPTVERLDAAARARFERRRAVCRGHVTGRAFARALGVANAPLVRVCARALRRLARALVG